MYGDNKSTDSVLDMKEKLKMKIPKKYKRYFFMGLLIVAAIWLASGIYIVNPGEQAVVRQFGKQVDITGPGLNYRLPYPIQIHDKVDVSTIRRAEIGFRTEGGAHSKIVRVSRESMMLTGDENIIDVQLAIQYVVRDPSDFLFNVRNPEQTLKAAGEVALRGMVGENTVDHTMTEGRVLIQEDVQKYLQSLLDLYETGIYVTEARLLTVDPPDQVKEAFHDVVRAWEDRERLVQEAEAYRENIVPRARGQAIEMIREAEAYRERRILEAQGDSGKFIEILEQYTLTKDVTRQRMYLEMMEKVMPGVKKYIIDGQKDSNLIQLLPLSDREGE